MRAAGLAIVVAACGGSDPLESDADIAAWANASSALGAFETVREPVAFADGAFMFPDPGCPATADDGVTATITGGCRDVEVGDTWTGTATVTRDGSTRTVTLVDYGNDALVGPVRATGTVTITEQAPDQHAFEVDVVRRSGITESVRYTGTVNGTYDTTTTWNGSGRISRAGDFIEGGTVTAETVDQVRDQDVCGESLSGTTTITSPKHVIVIAYDGATACDNDHAARFSRDGEDRGLVLGVTCSAGGDPRWLGLALGALLLRRRRR